MPDALARVVNFQLCKDEDCYSRSSAPTHLLVTEHRVRLQARKATAISYTWGEFRRQKRCIGHYADGSDTVIELGEEWDLVDLARTLDGLCRHSSSPQYCWVDQLCIAQDNAAEVRETLAKIPDIYRAFDVAVIFPGARCSCVSKRVEVLSDAIVAEATDEDLADILLSMNCPNDLSFLTWGQRIWPRQELLYSKGLQFLWCSQSSAQCPGWWTDESDSKQQNVSTPDFDLLTTAPKCWFDRAREVQRLAGKDRSFAEDMLRYQSINALSAYADSISLWLETHVGEAVFDDFSHERFALGLLDGERIQMGEPDQRDLDNFLRKEGFDNFLRILSNLQTSQRKASKARDYILSIWVDCPGYKIPVEYDKMSLGALLEDAVEQLERNHGVSLVTYAPIGMFGPKTPSALWRPSYHLEESKIDRVGPVYSAMLPFTCPSDDPLRQGGLPTRKISARCHSGPIDLQQYLADNPETSALELLVDALYHWHRNAANIISYVWSSDDSDPSAASRDATENLYDSILGYIIIDKLDELTHLIASAKEKPQINAHEIVRSIVGHALGLTTDAVKKTGLRVMMRHPTEDTPSMLGLTWYEHGKDANAGSYPLRLHLCREKDRCSNNDQCESMNVPPVIYEVVNEGANNSVVAMQVLGVWAPIRFGEGEVE